MNLRAFDEHTFHVCSECVALCPYGEGECRGWLHNGGANPIDGPANLH
jgi:hypothetical protein